MQNYIFFFIFVGVSSVGLVIASICHYDITDTTFSYQQEIRRRKKHAKNSYYLNKWKTFLGVHVFFANTVKLLFTLLFLILFSNSSRLRFVSLKFMKLTCVDAYIFLIHMQRHGLKFTSDSWETLSLLPALHVLYSCLLCMLGGVFIMKFWKRLTSGM